jgi:hypothetical protein
MKAKRLYVLTFAALLAICIRGEVLQRRYRAALVDERMKFQMEAIKNRARDFMEMKLHQPFFPAHELVAPMKHYELEIRVPPGSLPEFLGWMRGMTFDMAQVDGWPREGGCTESLGNSEFSYKVYYGNKQPSDF